MKKIFTFILALLISNMISEAKIVPIHIIYTSDEHGWMISEGKSGGAAELYNQWLNEDSINVYKTLILSGGDNFTGPAISTYTEGKAMLEVMDEMGYFASTFGNHEFDFGKDNLLKLVNSSKRNFIAANVQFEDPVNNNFVPYKEKTINGVKTIIVGLGIYDLSSLTSMRNIEGMKFSPYLASMEKFKNKIKKADVAILISHLCASELKVLLPDLVNMGFDVVAGGHCHSNIATMLYGVPLLEGAPYLRGYSKVIVNFDTDNKKIVNCSIEKKKNKAETKNPKIEKIINKWKENADIVLNEKIGYSENTVKDDTPELVNLFLKPWIKSFPQAQIAITNKGSIRQGIPAGDITIATIMGILPFQNDLVIFEIRGDELKTFLKETSKAYIYGINLNDNFKLDNGEYLKDNEYYKVITTDFVYNRGDGFRVCDVSRLILNTYTNFREPIIDYLKSLNTSLMTHLISI